MKAQIKNPKEYFYFNIYGWEVTLTKEPTFATPTGRLWNSGFPRIVKKVGDKIIPTKLIELPK